MTLETGRQELMKVSMRRFSDQDDYWRIRAFLRRVFLANERRELCWQVYRFDYWRWHGILNMKDGTLETDVFIWETADGEIAAVLNREAPGSVFLQVHPSYRNEEIEEEMVAVAEEHLTTAPTGRWPRLRIWAVSDDLLRRRVLRKRGYRVFEGAHSKEYARWRDLDADIPKVDPPPGYKVRSLGPDAELPERSYASWLAFHPDAVGEAHEKRDDPSWYRNIQNAPLYRRDLDLVAEAPGGAIAAFSTVWFDDVCRTGAFEPVGTVPAHQRRGLAMALMIEGLRRLRRIGATRAYVGSYSPGAHAAYEAAGFTHYELLEPWTKDL
jgi:mycothiol synthase